MRNLNTVTKIDSSIPIESSIFEESSQSHEKASSVEISEEKESISDLLDMVTNGKVLTEDNKKANKEVLRTQSLFLGQFREDERKLRLSPKKKMSFALGPVKQRNNEHFNASKPERRCSSLTDINMILRASELSPIIDRIDDIRSRAGEALEYNDSIQDIQDYDEDCSCQLCSCSSCCEDSKCDITNSSMEIHEFSNDEKATNMKTFPPKHQLTLNECR